MRLTGREEKFATSSYAALYAMQDAVSTAKAANGWIRWKTAGEKILADLRQEYLATKQISTPSEPSHPVGQ
jgi:hypothetical protein